MARLTQLNPQNYSSSGKINADFESIIRYINSAEYGNKTLGELLSVLFDTDGNFDGPIELRNNLSSIQYRVGNYADPEENWVTLANLSDLRGAAGINVGNLQAPVLTNRQDITATSGQTDFTYISEEQDDLLIYVNGLLQSPTLYTWDTAGFSFNTGLADGDLVTVQRVRTAIAPSYNRTDITTVSTQQVFGYDLTENDNILVYLNGILLRQGGAYDYTLQFDESTITLNSPIAAGNLLTILRLEDGTIKIVTGLMLEADYVDETSGLIQLDKVLINDDALTLAKVDGLSDLLAERAIMTVSSATPAFPSTADLWLDTSAAPNQLKFYDGTQWLRTSPDSSIPTFTELDAGKYLRLNNTGTGMEYGDLDLSSRIATTARGAANGVASLDSTGRLPYAQLPVSLGNASYYHFEASAANTSYVIQRVFKQKLRIDGISLTTDTGSCDVQIEIDGVAVGNVYAASPSALNATLSTPIEIDASLTSKAIGFIVTNNSTAANLSVTLAAANISS